MNIDYDGSLKLLAICVALAAYIGNIRRDMSKRCTALKEEKVCPTDKVKIKQITDEWLKIENKIFGLLWSDVPLVLAGLSILAYWSSPFFTDFMTYLTNLSASSEFFLGFARFLFGFAVITLAMQHFIEGGTVI
jgi:hypothetical protein